MPSFTHSGIVSTAHQITYGQRGWRDARDIIEAALEQGWTWRYAGKSHLRLTPPTKDGTPVGISGTPSDTNYRRQIVRQMRKNGFIWPWPPEGGETNHKIEEKTVATTVEAVPEIWRELDNVPGFELSNGGVCRNMNTGKIIKPQGNGFIRLTTHKGRTIEKNVRGLVIAHFGHPPIKNVVPDTAAERHRSREAGRMLEPLSHSLGDYINQEKIVTATEVEEKTVAEDNGWVPIDWVPNITEGYVVHSRGIVRNPGGKTLRASTIGAQLWISLRRSDTGTTRTVRLDKIVLRGFRGAPTNETDAPVHIDGNTKNCALENLRWPDAQEDAEPSPAVQVTDEASEPQEVDPPINVPVQAKPTPEQRLMALPYEERVLEVLEQVKPQDVPIDLLDLTVRTYNLLHREGLHTSGLVAEKCPNDLRNIRNFGEASVAEIQGKLADLGLSMQPNPPEAEPYEHQDAVDKVVAEAPGLIGEETPRQRKLRKQREKRAAARKASTPRRGGRVSRAKDELEVLRVYRRRGAQLTVDGAGLGELSKKAKLSTEEMEAMADMLSRAVEMNRMMGFK